MPVSKMNEDKMTNWGMELQRARLAANMRRRKDLAEASGVAKATIDALERGERNPRQETLQALREVLPDLRLPLEVSMVGADPRDPNGYAVHLPMDPAARARMLADLLRLALEEQDTNLGTM